MDLNSKKKRERKTKKKQTFHEIIETDLRVNNILENLAFNQT